MCRLTANRLARLFAAAIYTTISLPVMAEITDGNPVPAGPVHLQCWQYGVKVIDERGLEQTALSSTREPGVMSFRRDADAKGSVLVVPTANAICLVKNER
ncbi:exported hypothetical protein [Gammaproteobacteria bacterium]